MVLMSITLERRVAVGGLLRRRALAGELLDQDLEWPAIVGLPYCESIAETVHRFHKTGKPQLIQEA